MDIYQAIGIGIQVVVAVVQIASLIALIVYVWKTWEMASSTRLSAEMAMRTLQEIKATRDEETAPYVVVYFDIPFGGQLIYLVVKNIGKTPANHVRLRFDPPLRNSDGDKIAKIPLLSGDSGALPPNYEIRTFFDSYIQYNNTNHLPQSYVVEVSFFGGTSKAERRYTQIMDLKMYHGLMFSNEKDMEDLVKQVEKIANHQSKIRSALESLSDNIEEGIWVRNINSSPVRDKLEYPLPSLSDRDYLVLDIACQYSLETGSDFIGSDDIQVSSQDGQLSAEDIIESLEMLSKYGFVKIKATLSQQLVEIVITPFGVRDYGRRNMLNYPQLVNQAFEIIGKRLSDSDEAINRDELVAELGQPKMLLEYIFNDLVSRGLIRISRFLGDHTEVRSLTNLGKRAWKNIESEKPEANL